MIDCLKHSKLLHDLDGAWKERLANVVAREALFFEKQDPASPL